MSNTSTPLQPRHTWKDSLKQDFYCTIVTGFASAAVFNPWDKGKPLSFISWVASIGRACDSRLQLCGGSLGKSRTRRFRMHRAEKVLPKRLRVLLISIVSECKGEPAFSCALELEAALQRHAASGHFPRA